MPLPSNNTNINTTTTTDCIPHQTPEDKALSFAKQLYQDPNHANTFGEKGTTYRTATSNTSNYAKKVDSNHERFVKIVIDAITPLEGNPGDPELHEMFAKQMDMPDGIRKDKK